MLQFLLLSIVFAFSASLPAYGQPATDAPAHERIRQAAADQLVRQYSLSASQIEIRIDQLEADLDSRGDLRLTFSDRWETPRGRVQAEISSSNAGDRWTKSGWALLYVSHFDSVIVSREPLRPNDELKPSEIKRVRVDVTQLREQPLTTHRFRDRCTTDPCYLRQYIQEGDIIRRDAVRHRYAVRSGEMVEMTYRRRGITANLRCRARRSGFVGDTVRIACSSTGSMYRVRLTDEGTAEWQETL